MLEKSTIFFFPSYHKKEIITQQVKKKFFIHIFILRQQQASKQHSSSDNLCHKVCNNVRLESAVSFIVKHVYKEDNVSSLQKIILRRGQHVKMKKIKIRIVVCCVPFFTSQFS